MDLSQLANVSQKQATYLHHDDTYRTYSRQIYWLPNHQTGLETTYQGQFFIWVYNLTSWRCRRSRFAARRYCACSRLCCRRRWACVASSTCRFWCCRSRRWSSWCCRVGSRRECWLDGTDGCTSSGAWYPSLRCKRSEVSPYWPRWSCWWLQF